MSKRDIKSNKLERKNNLKRKHGSNFRSMNPFQILDKIPNDNLYKNDNLYSINKYLEFSPNEEQSFRLFCHYHYQNNVIKRILLLVFIRFLGARINKFTDIFSFYKIFNVKNIFHLISFFISYIFTKNNFLKKELLNICMYYLFSFNQFIHIYSIYYAISPDLEMHLAIPSELIFNLFYLFFLNTKLKHTVIPFMSITFTYIYSSNIFSGLNILFFVPLGICFSILLYMLIMKSIREIWALFDSFKRSYYNINQGLLDSDPNPIFIISKDKNILYRNTAAIQLTNNILEIQNTQKRVKRNKDDRFNTINFLDIIHPNLRELFIKLLNDVMEDDTVTSFNFPLFKKNNQQNINLNVSNAYDINDENNYLYFIWFHVLVCKTEWKNKPAYYMCLITSDDILFNEIFYQYTKRFSEKIENVISTSDIIALAFFNKITNKNKSSSSINSVKKNENEEEKNDFASPKKNIYKLLVENEDNIELNNTILYFFKNQVELLYDYSLTLEIYFTMLYKERNFKFNFNSKKKIPKKKIKLNELKSYYLEYFYDFTREHKYRLEFKNDESKTIYDINIEENYLRMILFNVIVFMICYLDDKTEPGLNSRKEIVIKLIPEIKEDSKSPLTPESNTKEYSDSEKNIKNGELSVILQSYSSKKDLNKIQNLLNQKNKNNRRLKAEIIKLNYIDIGLLTVKYLLENYYKTNLTLSSEEGEQYIQFKIPCDLELSTDSINYKKNININSSPGSTSFFTSPLIHSKQLDIHKPKNFYNYNQNYNKKVLNIFYGIEKSPEIRSRHRRGMPSFSVLNEEKNKSRRYLRNLSQNIIKFSDENIPIYDNNEQNIIYYIDDSNKGKNQEKEKENDKKKDKNNKHIIKSNNANQFSFKMIDFSFNSEEGSKSDKDIIEEENENNIKNEKETKNTESDKIKENKSNEVLIFEDHNNKDLIPFLNNESKGQYILKVIKDISEVENELKTNNGKCKYRILLINMGNNKEIKFAETICENKGDSLIYGYHFGVSTKSKEKNNVKFDKRFDLSFSYEGILYAIKNIFIGGSSIIK